MAVVAQPIVGLLFFMIADVLMIVEWVMIWIDGDKL